MRRHARARFSLVGDPPADVGAEVLFLLDPDIERHALDILSVKKRLNEIYVRHTGQPYEVVEKTLDRDSFMTASEAQAFGIVDKVYEKRAAAAD